MSSASILTHPFARRRLSIFGKTTVVALVILLVLCAVLSLLVHSLPVFIVAVVTWLVATLIVLGFTWTPLFGIIFNGVLLYAFLFIIPFPMYHLQHPKDPADPATFPIFIFIAIMLCCMFIGLVASSIALVQNYLPGEHRAPRWYSAALSGMIGMLVGAVLIAALSQPTASAATATTVGGQPAVHMGISNFTQSTVTIAKGSKLVLVDDGTFHHNLSLGSWQNGQPLTEQQAGAPPVNNLDINGKNVEIGPFTTAGSYHIYCSLHRGMNLTVIVQ